MMIMSFPLGYYNRAQVIPMFFGFLLLVFNGVQEDIEADQTDEKPAVDTAVRVPDLTPGSVCDFHAGHVRSHRNHQSYLQSNDFHVAGKQCLRHWLFRSCASGPWLPMSELPALVLETNKMMIMRFPLWYHNCAQVIPMFFGFLLLVFNGVQVGIEADQTDDKPAVDTAVTVPDLYYNCAQVIPMFFGFLLLVFNGVQEDIEANSASDIQRKPTAADWMSGSSFVGMAGTLYALGYDGLAYIIGWTRGYVLVSTMISPYLRRFGSFTRGKNRGAQLRVPVPGDHRALSCSFTYLTAQVYSTGVIVSRFIGIQFEVAVFSCIISVIFCSLLGGMRAVTYTQVAQYVILIIAYTVPAICMSTAQDVGFNKNKPVELLAYGGTLQQNALKEKERVLLGLASKVADSVCNGASPSLVPCRNRLGVLLCTLFTRYERHRLAPYLRRFGSFAVPEFIGSRDEGTMQLPGEKVVELSGVSRFLATSVLLSCSFTYLIAQVDSIGVIVSRFIGIQLRWPSSAASSVFFSALCRREKELVLLGLASKVTPSRSGAA
ncbi:unnamed protein product, partial [Polarella glacialis]